MKIMNALMLLSLTVFISSCSNAPVHSVTVETKVPPSILLQECPAPKQTGNTFRDVLQRLNRFKHSLKKCNADKAALREWVTNETPKDN